MKIDNQYIKHLLTGLLTLFIVACQEPVKESSLVLITGKITEDTTWSASKSYVIDQQVTVENGATLTIEPGTIIKANPGEAPNVSMLVIAKGGKIMAKGTAEKPIIFTSINDNLDPKQNVVSALSDADVGLWGGIIILGNAPIELPSGESETFYVGLDPNSASSYYGGTDPQDNSGVMEYVSVRHGGIFIGTGSESNGITLCGVGAGTTLQNIEIFANQDDGIEFFGGDVHVKNLLVHASGDDAIDIDEGFAGSVSNFVVELNENSDSAIEVNGITADSERQFSLANGRIDGADQILFTMDDKSKGKITGLTITNSNEMAAQNNASVNVSIEITEENSPALDAFAWTRARQK